MTFPAAYRGATVFRSILPMLFCLLCLLPALPAAASDTVPADWTAVLTDAERAWIRAHPVIRIGYDPEFHPFEFRDERGQYAGIASEYVQLLRVRFGLNMQAVPDIDWKEAVARMSRGEIDVLPCVGISVARAKFAVFSDTYIRYQRVILTRTDMPFISGLHDIENLRVGVQGSSSHEGFLHDRTAIRPDTYPSLEACLRGLSTGEVDAAVGNLASATYWIRKYNLLNLKVAAPASTEVSTLHFAVRRDWPELCAIINKGLALVPPAERRVIEQKWIAVEYRSGIDPGVVARAGAAGMLVLAGILLWLYRLKAEIRRRRETEQTLAQARDRAEAADRVKSAFLATMSHELRTPLNSIIGFTGVLLQELSGPLNSEQHKQLNMVRASGQHLLALINDILDISKIEAGELVTERAPFNLGEAVRAAVQSVLPLAEKKGLTLHTELDPENVMLVSDRRRVEQILLNLLSNAVKFTATGTVTVRVRMTDGTPARVCVAVTDTGSGIAAEDRETIFRPFRQLDAGLDRKHEGTGLGLAICQRLAELLGGTITVESECGRGSTFRLTLPVDDRTRPEQANRP